MSELGLRVTTGLIGGGALLVCLLAGGWIGIFVITLVVTLGMVNEFAQIALNLPDKKEKRYFLLLLSWLSVTCWFVMQDIQFGILIGCFIAIALYFLATAPRHAAPGGGGPAFAEHFKEAMASVFGLVYTVFIPLFLPLIRAFDHGQLWILLCLLIVFAGDTGAYFGGKKWGKRKLYPLISPKKTVEGALTGLASGVVITFLYKRVALPELTWRAVIFLPLLVGSFAQAGDFFESYLKRAFDKKDSGSILPGHGGFLDRFDGVVFGLPIMYAGIKLLG